MAGELHVTGGLVTDLRELAAARGVTPAEMALALLECALDELGA